MFLRVPVKQLALPKYATSGPFIRSPAPGKASNDNRLKVSVIIPALNEEMSIGEVVRQIPKQYVTEIIVVDNGSADRTAEVAAAAGATVLSERRRGYGYACLTGIAHAVKAHPPVIVFLDGDLGDYPEELPSLLQPIQESGYDLVIAPGLRFCARMGINVLRFLGFQL